MGGVVFTLDPLKANPDPRELRDPPGSGGLLMALYHYHRLMTQGKKGFEGEFAAYTGATRNSGINNWDVMKRHIDSDRDVQQRFARIRDIAGAMRDALERGDWPEVGRQIAAEWENRKGLAPGVTTPGIDAMLAAARGAGAYGGKVCGAGGGGCLFCLSEPDRVPAIRDAIAEAGGALLDFRIEPDGLRVETRVTA